tara:strand:+ start:6191 stop:6514 length:324 start_codon:yes stop_codon:yes gene_type:complete
MALFFIILYLPLGIHAIHFTATGNDAHVTTNSPTWLGTVTFTLLCYDVFAAMIFCWLWVCGYLAWMKHRPMGQEIEGVEMGDMGGRRGASRGRQTLMESELRRLGMV